MRNKVLSFFTAMALCVSACAALAQTYPVTNPSYQPNPVIAPVSVASTATLPSYTGFQLNGVSTLAVRFSGTFTGLVASVQVTESRATSPTWTTILAQPSGGQGAVASISSSGIYRFNVNGYAQARVVVSSLSTGTVVVGASASPGDAFSSTTPLRRPTYSAVATGLTPASSATDFFTLSGSASTTIKVLRAECSGTSTAAATAVITALVRSTANSGGTATTLTNVPYDSSAPAATAVAKSYTANPTTGTLTGNVGVTLLTTVTAATTALPPKPATFTFGAIPLGQEIVLRGAAQTFALNAGGNSLTSGASLNCTVEWTEE